MLASHDLRAGLLLSLAPKIMLNVLEVNGLPVNDPAIRDTSICPTGAAQALIQA
jgi:hypothetical protein